MVDFDKDNKVICILGMHRSEISRISCILNIQGLFFGDEDEFS